MRHISLCLSALILGLLVLPAESQAQSTADRADRLQRVIDRQTDRAEAIQRQQQRLQALERLQRLQAYRRALYRRMTIAERRANAQRMLAQTPKGRMAVRGQILMVGRDPALLERLRKLGFRVKNDINLSALALELTVLTTPVEMEVAAALDLLRAREPDARFELNHVFDPAAEKKTSQHAAARSVERISPLPWHDLTPVEGVRLGLVDLGVDPDHPSLKGAKIETAVFTGEDKPSPSAHGTAVASLLVGKSTDGDTKFHGAAQGAHLFAADAFGEADVGGSALDIVRALTWLSENKTIVIAMPLVGPPNLVLELALDRLHEQGVLIVAPVGNEGPTRPIAYPAAYESVVAVTATDWQGKVYLGANRGAQVMFSAVGVNIPAAADSDALVAVSGTSYAVPEVAARLLRRADDGASNAITMLQSSATDLGQPGHDDVYGFGLVSKIVKPETLAQAASVE